MLPAVSASITIIAVPAEDPDSFEAMYTEERRHRSAGWKTFTACSGKMLDTFFMKATDSDLGVFECEPEVEPDGQKLQTCLIDRQTVLHVLPTLENLVETNADATARALVAHGGGNADLARTTQALKVGTWPERGEPAEEAAAFAHHLLKYARIAAQERRGVCWEFRGDFVL